MIVDSIAWQPASAVAGLDIYMPFKGTVGVGCVYDNGCAEHITGSAEQFAIDWIFTEHDDHTIYSASDGTVLCAGKAFGGASVPSTWAKYGNIVVIKKELLVDGQVKKYLFTYAHLASIDTAIKKDLPVTPTTVLGIAGKTGGPTGTGWPEVHLHFSVRKDGDCQDNQSGLGPYGGNAEKPEPLLGHEQYTDIKHPSFMTSQSSPPTEVYLTQPIEAGSSARLEYPISVSSPNLLKRLLILLRLNSDARISLIAPNGTFIDALTPDVGSSHWPGEWTMLSVKDPAKGEWKVIIDVIDATPQTVFVLLAGAETSGLADTSSPDTTITSGPSSCGNSTAATFTFSGSDDRTSSSDLVFAYQIDSGTWSAFSTTTSVSLSNLSDGNHTFRVNAEDQAGNEDPSPAEYSFQIDTSPPITSTSLSGTQGNHGWYRSAVTATLSASDTGCGSSSIRTEYNINDSGWVTYSSPITFNLEGRYTFAYRSVDGAGNVEATKTSQVNIDWTPPVTTGNATGSRDMWSIFRSCVETALTPTDNVSGIESILISLDNGTTWNPYTSVVTLCNNGVYNLLFRSVDRAGNEEQPKKSGPIDIQRFIALVKSLLSANGATTIETQGVAHSNGDVSLTNNTTVKLDVLHYIGQFTQSENVNFTINQQARVTTPMPISDYPLRFYRGRCQFVSGPLTISDTSPVYNKCYYATGDVTFNTTGATGKLTIVSEGKIYDQSTNSNIQSWDTTNGILFYAVKGYVSRSTGAVYNGIIYVPTSTIEGPFTNETLNGGLFASTVSLGSGTTLNARQAPGFPASTHSFPLTQVASFTSIAAEDGYILESSETSNKGGSISSTATTCRVGDDSSDRQYVCIASFDTSLLPDNATILSANLYLRRFGLTGTSPFSTHGTLWVDVKTGAYGDNNSLQTTDFEVPSTATGVTSLSNPANNGDWSSGSFNSAGLTTINRMGRTQVKIRFNLDDNDDLGSDYISFYSGNDLTTSNRPVMVITYVVP